MELLPTRLSGVKLIAPRVFGDDRGFFMESYRRNVFADLGIPEEMVQQNHSRSTRGVLRGMHFQIGDGASKLVRCARGRIWDVLVDIRHGSPTFGEWEAFELDDEQLHVLYAPIGFAHGFCVLSDVADVVYQQSNYYSGEVERGFSVDDPAVGIDWPIAEDERIVSDRDRDAPLLAQIAAALPF
jgi:dTDP-4-dehydrorhamnose 3,5-epimerase